MRIKLKILADINIEKIIPKEPVASIPFTEVEPGSIGYIFPENWTCYQRIDEAPLHPDDELIRNTLQYLPNIKLLQDFSPVFNVINRDLVLPDDMTVGTGPNGNPDEQYNRDFVRDEVYQDNWPIPSDILIQGIEPYFDIPETGPWTFSGIPNREDLLEFQHGNIYPGGDRHGIVLDDQYLHEFYKLFLDPVDFNWYAGYATRWERKRIPEEQRLDGQNSADAAGLPILPLLLGSIVTGKLM